MMFAREAMALGKTSEDREISRMFINTIDEMR
jgi:hypothetical protein